MSQEVVIAGALFSDVPSIKVPDSNNVYHDFVDTSDANATRNDIMQGYTRYVNGSKITGTATGGAGSLSDVVTPLQGGGDLHTITAIDLSQDTVDARHLVQGYTAHDASGTAITGSLGTGTEGTPVATKGTVLNHSVSVTPSVTNTAGVISGGTRTGTAVTVSASELVSGSQTITTNNTYDVTNLASVTVNVSGGGGVIQPLSVTQNGTYTRSGGVDGYSPVTVNVSGGGGGDDKQIFFIDYDGTELHSYSKTEWQSVSALPSNPSHTGLVAQGWNWTKADIDAQLTAVSDSIVIVGQLYTTSSGATEIDVSFTDAVRLTPILSFAVKGTVEIDWGDNTTPSTLTGTSYTTRKDANHTYSATGDYTIKITATSGDYAFYTASSSYQLLRKTTNAAYNRVYSNCIKEIRAGDDLIGIGAYGCDELMNLEHITMSTSITFINTYAFYNCLSLKAIVIPSGITFSSATNAFYSCRELKVVSLPKSITTIPSYTFYNCGSLTKINGVIGILTLGDGAFAYCSSLKSITGLKAVTSIGGTAFSCCYSLESFSCGNSITSIGNSVFGSCYNLKAVDLSGTATSMGTGVFQDCRSIRSVVLPNSLTSIGDGTFRGCQSIETITIPNSVTSFGTQAFYNCYALTAISLPSGITTVSKELLYNTFNIKSLTIPNTVTSVADSAFSGLYTAFSLTLPNALQTIGVQSFRDWYSIASLTIPSTVTSIGNNAFMSCSGLYEIHVLPTTPPTAGTTIFANIRTDCKIYVPQASLADYQAASGWSTYASYMVGE